VSCEKDKYTTEPQIEFKKFSKNSSTSLELRDVQPYIYLDVRDAEGDLGFIPGEDTAKIYMKNLLVGLIDSSLVFPALDGSAHKNFHGELQIGLFSILKGTDRPFSERPYSDTLYFEVYIKDFAGNKSNTIITSEPFIYHTLP
jgi:hypothetical protein